MSKRSLPADAARHGFLALVGYLERLAATGVRLGENGPPEDEPVRFRHDPALAFSSSDISRVEEKASAPDIEGEAAARPAFEVVTTFLGVTGAVSPLPAYLPEEVAREDPDHPVQRDFLDLFHHRLVSLLYRLLSKHSYPLEYRADGEDEWSRRVLCLLGFDPFASSRLPAPPWRLLRLAPLLLGRNRSARMLEVALQDILGPDLGGAEVEIVQFTGTWLRLEDEQQIRLGRANSSLGRNTVIGSRIYDRVGRFRIVLAPVALGVYERFLPGGDLMPRLRDAVAWVLADPLAYEVELVLGADAVPPLVLGRSRLAQDTWLGGRRGKETRVAFPAVT